MVEEGIDIPACHLVVRYNGVPTAASYVQSRGRARMRNSVYVIMSAANDTSEREALQKLRMGERHMRLAAMWCESYGEEVVGDDQTEHTVEDEPYTV